MKRVEKILNELSDQELAEIWVNGLNSKWIPQKLLSNAMREKLKKKLSKKRALFLQQPRSKMIRQISESLEKAGSNSFARQYRKISGSRLTWKQMLVDYNDKLLPIMPRKKKELRGYLESMGRRELWDRVGLFWTTDKGWDKELTENQCEELAQVLFNFTVWEWFKRKGRETKARQELETIVMEALEENNIKVIGESKEKVDYVKQSFEHEIMTTGLLSAAIGEIVKYGVASPIANMAAGSIFGTLGMSLASQIAWNLVVPIMGYWTGLTMLVSGGLHTIGTVVIDITPGIVLLPLLLAVPAYRKTIPTISLILCYAGQKGLLARS